MRAYSISAMIAHGTLCAVILCTGQACNTNTMFIHALTSVQNHFEEHDARVLQATPDVIYIIYNVYMYIYNYIDW